MPGIVVPGVVRVRFLNGFRLSEALAPARGKPAVAPVLLPPADNAHIEGRRLCMLHEH